MKRIGIDARALEAGPAGVRTYVAALLEHLPELDPVTSPFPGNNFLRQSIRIPLQAARRGWQLYHAPAYTAPLFLSVPVVLSVHDVSYLRGREVYPYRLDLLRRTFYRQSLQRAGRILVPSDFSYGELVVLHPELKHKVRVVRLGVSESFKPDPDLARRVRDKFSLPDRYLLHVGDIHPRRNLSLLIRVAHEVALPLVAVGNPIDVAQDLLTEVTHLQDVGKRDLQGIYCGAEAFVYASVYEGFGLPVLEAMACGLPVVAARRASIPEVCGEAAILVEPELGTFVEGLREVFRRRESFASAGLQQARQFSWDRTAGLTRKVYEELLT